MIKKLLALLTQLFGGHKIYKTQRSLVADSDLCKAFLCSLAAAQVSNSSQLYYNKSLYTLMQYLTVAPKR